MMCLNHPQTIPPTPVHTVVQESGPWCQKGWGPLVYTSKHFEISSLMSPSPSPTNSHHIQDPEISVAQQSCFLSF